MCGLLNAARDWTVSYLLGYSFAKWDVDRVSFECGLIMLNGLRVQRPAFDWGPSYSPALPPRAHLVLVCCKIIRRPQPTSD